ncbi:flagellar motor protein MotB [Acuticoccus sp. I52.16.1]|uniref:flagellar motor protein MotB n=1 Tax=Acuticoccus sp. I52.16.1 TaxID=2928472 RepID=UPI001FD2692C|nr:flagellar motor protein MotB [Acuticoccus sp. I52.16.1]UOM34287.1 OmpA family protein [Acuticoccus sp. I52.16.1]
MSNNPQELIILKRIEEVADAKKGGAWKVAHADFMTAMMAFFLIMWLVNATDEEIKKSIANYFNPMNLMASPTDVQGINDPTKDTQPPASGDEAGQPVGDRPMGSNSPGDGGSASGGGNVEIGNDKRMDSSGVNQENAGAVFHDPYAMMTSAAAEVAPDDPVAVDVPQANLGAEGNTDMSQQPRDPFDPAYWQTTSPRPARSVRPGPNDTPGAVPDQADIDAADRTPTEAAGPASPDTPHESAPADAVPGQPAIAANNPPQDAQAPSVGPRSRLAEAVLAAYGDETASAAAAGAQPAVQDQAPDTPDPRAQSLAQAAQGIAAALSDLDADIGVTAGDTSVLISLTDDGPFSMFAIGSAEPNRQTEQLFARVAQALADRPGKIVVRGHTDARPFSSGSSDNWLLSFERAYATKQALVANGVGEDRISRVEGLADRELSNADDPFADENRRIEILYEPAEVTP